MTEKVCAVCRTQISAGNYCPECGQQLYPDVGKTLWFNFDNSKHCNVPKFDVWTGEKLDG